MNEDVTNVMECPGSVTLVIKTEYPVAVFVMVKSTAAELFRSILSATAVWVKVGSPVEVFGEYFAVTIPDAELNATEDPVVVGNALVLGTVKMSLKISLPVKL